MANCSYCDSFILIGGVSDPTGRYCNNRCQHAGHLLQFSKQIPLEALEELTHKIHQGNCPLCQGRGPVDVHKAHKIWSVLFLTSWSSSPEICCKRCATKRQLGAALFSGVLGWWGLPWGVILTPWQVMRNGMEILGGPSSLQPSSLLRKYVGMQAACRLIEVSRSGDFPMNGS